MTGNDDLINLKAGQLTVKVNPNMGGTIVSADYGDRQILRGNLGATDPREGGCFPLVPFCGALPMKGFSWRGETVSPPANLPGLDFAVHGYSWLAPWTIERLEENELHLSHLYKSGEWPWRYGVTQKVGVSDNSLVVSLELKNLSDELAPAGMGLHPYFPVTQDTVIETELDDPNYSGGVRAQHLEINQGFAGWDGHARVIQKTMRLDMRVTSSTKTLLALYRPQDAPFICLEPMTHLLNTAPEDATTGLDAIAPGDKLSLTMKIEVVPTI